MNRRPPRALTDRPIGEVPRTVDPLRFCVATTVAAIAWLITPPLAVTLFASLGVVAYWKAFRRGLLRSRCLIGDTRFVLAYLLLLAAGGITATILAFV